MNWLLVKMVQKYKWKILKWKVESFEVESGEF